MFQDFLIYWIGGDLLQFIAVVAVVATVVGFIFRFAYKIAKM